MTAMSTAGPDAHFSADRSEEKAFGFSIYLMTDAIIFALLFATYVVMLRGTADGPTGRDLFNLPRTFGETILLLFSSATFGFATLAPWARNAKIGDPVASADVHSRRRLRRS